MADTISIDRFSLATKEVYFQMKADQKAVYAESKNHKIQTAHTKLIDAWYKTKPLVGLLSKWRESRPADPWVLCLNVRAMNIVYGMLRGHSYRDIEATYHEGNGPYEPAILEVLRHYGIDADAFYEACGAIDYE